MVKPEMRAANQVEFFQICKNFCWLRFLSDFWRYL